MVIADSSNQRNADPATSSPTDRDNLVDRAQERASQYFSDRQMVTGTLAVYEEILARAGQRAA